MLTYSFLIAIIASILLVILSTIVLYKFYHSTKKAKNFYYVKKIIDILKNKKLPKEVGIPNEIKLSDTDDDEYYKKLYNNLLYYKLSNINMKEEAQQYMFNNIIEIIFLIYETNPKLFFISDFLHCLIFLVVEMTKSPIELNNESVINIFYGFQIDDLLDIEHSIINKGIDNFEKDMFLLIRKCLEKYIADFNMNDEFIKELDKQNKNIDEILKYIKTIPLKKREAKFPLPLYLDGLINYNKKTKSEKYIIIKIYKYFELYNNEQNNYYNLGYFLYSITSYKKKQNNLDLISFNDLMNKRLKNEFALKILKLSIELLKANNIDEFKEIYKKQNIKIAPGYPKISNNFENTDDYFIDLYNQLIYSVNKCIEKSTNCIVPLQDEGKRSLWLSYLEILLICLREDDIVNNQIKILFYLIVNIFSFQLNTNSLEFCDDTISVLFLDSIKDNYIFEFPELYRLYDSEYSNYYSYININSYFELDICNCLYSKIAEEFMFKDYIKHHSEVEGEINQIKKINKKLPFPILNKYLEKLGYNYNNNSFPNLGIKLLYKNAYNNIKNKKSKILLIENYHDPVIEKNMYAKINQTLQDKNFITLIKEIMVSRVMKESYELINKWYLFNGDFDIKEDIKDEKKTKIENEKEIKINESNLINKNKIIYYYDEFCKLLKALDFSKIFIIMRLPRVIKGFTFRFLKIIINCNGIKLNFKSDDELNELLNSYLIFVIVHEQNHFIKRYLNENVEYNKCRTPDIKNVDEGGEQLIDLLFGHFLINNKLDVNQAKYILDINNWKNKSLEEFRKDFLKINKTEESSSIVYLSSGHGSICDKTKLLI